MEALSLTGHHVRLVSSSPLRHLSSGRASEAQGLCVVGVVLTKHTEILLQENTERKAHRYVYVISPSKLNNMVVIRKTVQ